MLKRFLINRILERIYQRSGIEGINRLLLFTGIKYNPMILRKFGAIIGERTEILSPFIIHNAEKDYTNLKVGTGCHLGKDVLLDLARAIVIHNNVSISMRVTIITHLHVGYSLLGEYGFSPEYKEVVIQNGVYIGAGAIILHGVTLGECAAVAAGALVREDVPPYHLVGGVPARIIRKLEKKVLIDRPAEMKGFYR